MIGAKSLIGSYDSFCIAGLTEKASVVTRRVWPSGGALATAAVPIVLPPPGRLETITGCPQLSLSRCAIKRAMLSVVPPATNGTINSICLLGKFCAATGAVARMFAATMAAAAIERQRCMIPSPWRHDVRTERPHCSRNARRNIEIGTCDSSLGAKARGHRDLITVAGHAASIAANRPLHTSSGIQVQAIPFPSLAGSMAAEPRTAPSRAS